MTATVTAERCKVSGVLRGTVRVSVTRNESPGCRRDRCPSGREFAIHGLPRFAAGLRFYREFSPLRMVLEMSRCRAGRERRPVTVSRSGYVKMTIANGTPADTPRCSMVPCGAEFRFKDGELVSITIFLSRMYDDRGERCRG